jgi:hypothetical protein
MQLGDVARLSLASDDGVEFVRAGFKGPTPVVLTDFASTQMWTAHERWGCPAHLGALLGDEPSVVHCRDDGMTSFSPTNRNVAGDETEVISTMPWADCIQEIFGASEGQQQHRQLYLKSDLKDALRGDLGLGAALPGGRDTKLAKVWCGSSGNTTSLHFDLCHGLICQCVGKKRVTLFAPEDSQVLFPNAAGSNAPPRVSRMDLDAFQAGDAVQRSRFGAAARCSTGVECVLSQGEALYIPPYWWHHVVALSSNVSVLLPHDLSCAEQKSAVRPWTMPGWGEQARQ